MHRQISKQDKICSKHSINIIYDVGNEYSTMVRGQKRNFLFALCSVLKVSDMDAFPIINEFSALDQ